MFGTYNIFSFFSGFTFSSLSRLSHNSRYYDQPTSLLTNNQVDQQPSLPTEIVPPIEEETPPQDTIELSNTEPKTPTEESPVVYTPEMIEQNALETPAPVVEETPDEPANSLVAIKTKINAQFNMNMIFDLSAFEQTLMTFAEDAEDGQVNIASYTDLNIGLHTDLHARAHIRETFQVEEGMEGASSELKYKEKGRFSSLGAALLKSRGLEAGMFYKESLKTKFRLRQSYDDGFLRVSRKMALKYSQDFRLNLRSINMYNTQAETLDQSGNLDNYLTSAEALVDSPQSSSNLINQFFETVEGYLDGAEDQLIDKIESFFDTMASELGMDSGILASSREALIGSVESFFDRVETAVSSVTARYIPNSDEPELPEPPPEVSAPVEPDIQQEMMATAEA
ncbi:MAG: hypothetical protein V3W18_11500 [candidate division Zixibacteria bacterium]